MQWLAESRSPWLLNRTKMLNIWQFTGYTPRYIQEQSRNCKLLIRESNNKSPATGRGKTEENRVLSRGEYWLFIKLYLVM